MQRDGRPLEETVIDDGTAQRGAVVDVLVGLTARARRGDGRAFGSLYEHYAPMVHAVLLSRVRRVDAEDLLQDVFLSAWRGLSGLRDDEHLGAWLATIARNAANRHHRRAPPVPEAVPDELEDRGTPDGERLAEGAELLGVLRELPEAYRETLTMRLVEGMAGPEIAAASGLSPQSVRTNLSRGMKQLRERLRRKGWR